MADAARELGSFREVRAVAADAVQRRRCRLDQLTEELAQAPVRQSAWLRRALAEVADGVRSVAEGDLRDLIRAHGLPPPSSMPGCTPDGTSWPWPTRGGPRRGWSWKWTPGSGTFPLKTGSARCAAHPHGRAGDQRHALHAPPDPHGSRHGRRGNTVGPGEPDAPGPGWRCGPFRHPGSRDRSRPADRGPPARPADAAGRTVSQPRRPRPVSHGQPAGQPHRRTVSCPAARYPRPASRRGGTPPTPRCRRWTRRG